MPEISESLTRRVAELARLDLTGAEVSLFTENLRQILGYVDQLQAVNVEGIEPLTHPLPILTPLREDVVIPPIVDAGGLPKALLPAPEVLDGGFKVPPIL